MPTCWIGDEPHQVDEADWNERERSCNQCLMFERLEEIENGAGDSRRISGCPAPKKKGPRAAP